MSKASEWAKKREEAEGIIRARPAYTCPTLFGLPHMFGRVRDDGTCEIGFGGHSIYLNPADILALAAWLQETFGDKDAS